MHSFKLTSGKEATCTEGGTATYTCSKCHDSYTETSAATGHKFGSWKADKQPTCTSTGSEQRTCSRCGKTESRAVDALGHDWVHHDEEVEWVMKAKCRCGAIFATDAEWDEHTKYYYNISMETGDWSIADAHSGYTSYWEKVVIKAAYDSCSRCGMTR